MKPEAQKAGYSRLEAVDGQSGNVQFVIETPRGCRNKYKYDEKLGIFRLHTILPVGASFPFDFGYIPQTRAEDGDPLDAVVLMDEEAFPGCVIEGRLVGVIEAEQTEKNGQAERNDRLIGVCGKSHQYASVKSLADLPPHIVDEIEHFFVSYNELRGKTFKPLKRRGPNHAMKTLRQAAKVFRKGTP